MQEPLRSGLSAETRSTTQPHVLAAVFALLVSAAFHIFLLEKLPPMRLGRPIKDEDIVRYRAFELERRTPPAASKINEPARFRPEDPNQLREIFGEPEVDPAATAPSVPPAAPAIPEGPMFAQDKALAAPALPTTRSPWEPRQDILQVQDKLYDDAVSVLPRRMVERVERSPVAPDVVFPADAPDIQPAGGFGSGSGDLALTVSRPPADGAMASGAGGARGSAVPLQAADVFPGETSAFNEEMSNVTGLEPTEQYLALAVSSFQPADEPDATYVQVLISRRAEDALPVLPKDVLLMQDCSESMTAWKLIECKAGLRRWLDQLREGDRFDVMGFNDETRRCFGRWMEFNPASKARALRFIDDMRAQGNTDIFASLMAAEHAERDPARPLLAILVTDGRPTVGTTDSSDIIETFTKSNEGRVSMFAFGAGRRVNRFLLDLLCYRNRGDSLVVVDTDRIPSNMEAWAKEVRRPVLSDLTYHFSGVEEDQAFPATLTHLYLDRPLMIFARVPRSLERTAFQVVGRSGATQRDLLFELNLSQARPGTDELRTKWVWHRVYDRIGQFIQTRNPALWTEIEELAARYRLDIPYGKDAMGR